MSLPSWTDPLARYSALKESDRFRVIGRIVLALSVLAGIAYYIVEARPAPPSMDDMFPGYEKSQAREMGKLMGKNGVMMIEWVNALQRPGMQAVMIAAGGALFSLYFFRAATVLDDEERELQQNGER